jgi:hypothetical protein
MCAPSLPTSSGLQRWWCRSLESGQLNQPWLWHIYFTKPLIFFFSVHKPSQWVLIKVWPYFSQDQKVRNILLVILESSNKDLGSDYEETSSKEDDGICNGRA